MFYFLKGLVKKKTLKLPSCHCKSLVSHTEISGTHGGEYEECLLVVARRNLVEVYRCFITGAMMIWHRSFQGSTMKRQKKNLISNRNFYDVLEEVEKLLNRLLTIFWATTKRPSTDNF